MDYYSLCRGKVSGSEDYASTHLTEAPESISVPDSLSLGVILIQFSDYQTNWDGMGSVKDTISLDRYIFNNYYDMLFSEGIYIGFNVHPDENNEVFGSMRDYYLEVSHARPGGQFSLTGNILNDVDGNNVPIWYTASHPKSYYDSLALQDRSLKNEAIAMANNNGFNTDNYDKLCIIYAVQLGSNGHSLNSQADYVGGTFYITGEKVQNAFAHIGIHCHEFGHLLGLADSYHGAANDPPSYGRWGLMGTGYKNGPNYGSQPVHIAGPNKAKLQFAPVVNLNEDLYSQTIYPTSNNNSCILFLKEITFWIEMPLGPILEKETFTIENRQKIAGTFDQSLPGEGLLIFNPTSTVD